MGKKGAAGRGWGGRRGVWGEVRENCKRCLQPQRQDGCPTLGLMEGQRAGAVPSPRTVDYQPHLRRGLEPFPGLWPGGRKDASGSCFLSFRPFGGSCTAPEYTLRAPREGCPCRGTCPREGGREGRHQAIPDCLQSSSPRTPLGWSRARGAAQPGSSGLRVRTPAVLASRFPAPACKPPGSSWKQPPPTEENKNENTPRRGGTPGLVPQAGLPVPTRPALPGGRSGDEEGY